MPAFRIPKSAYSPTTDDGFKYEMVGKSIVDKFSVDVLGITEFSHTANAVDCIAAVFDLAGFTHFCGGVDPKFYLPKFLSIFLQWLIDALRKETIRTYRKDEAVLWHRFPFYLKFLGDGILVLWNIDKMSRRVCNSVCVSMAKICCDYQTELFPKLEKDFVEPPHVLRCGMAIGTVFSVDSLGTDYIGSPINIAARLQKLPGITFAVNKNGFENSLPEHFQTDTLALKRVVLRGIGEKELVYIRTSEFNAMNNEQKAFYSAI